MLAMVGTSGNIIVFTSQRGSHIKAGREGCELLWSSVNNVRGARASSLLPPPRMSYIPCQSLIVSFNSQSEKKIIRPIWDLLK